MSEHKEESIILVSILIFSIYFIAAGFLRYDNFYTGRFDLGNMDQTVWNTIHGRIFQITDPNGTQMISRLAFHADFILILISPLYLIWASPKMLILFQVLVMALGAIFVYLISKEVIKNKSISLVFSICFLLFPAIQYNLLFDFHGVTLATTFLLACFYYFIKNKYVLFLFFAVLAGISKEEVWLIVGLFGLLISLRSYIQAKKITQNFLFGILVSASGFIIFYLLIGKVIPIFRGKEHFALSYFSDFGTSPSGIFANILLNPIKTFTVILKPDNLVYLFELFAPLGFLSFTYLPVLIFTIPDLLISTLSNNPQLHQIYYQYSSAVTPFIFISSIYGVKVIRKKFSKIPITIISFYLLFWVLISQYYVGPFLGSKNASLDMFTKPLANSKEIEQVLNKIPKRYSIAATNNLGSHLSRRRNIYTIPLGINNADLILFLQDHGYSSLSDQDQSLLVQKIENDPKYYKAYEKDNFVIYEKQSLSPNAIKF